MRALTDGINENHTHFAMDKVEWAIETDQYELARKHMREAIAYYTKLQDPIAYANAMTRQARLAEKLQDLWMQQ